MFDDDKKFAMRLKIDNSRTRRKKKTCSLRIDDICIPYIKNRLKLLCPVSLANIWRSREYFSDTDCTALLISILK